MASLTPVDGNPFAGSQGTQGGDPNLTPVEGNPFASTQPDDSFDAHNASAGDVLKTAASNFGGSLASNLGNVGHAVMHPIETAENLGQVAEGEVGLGGDEAAQKAHAVNQFYKDRYTNWDGFKKAVAEDPFGVIMDLGTVADPAIGGAARAGMLGARTANLARAAVNPVFGAAKLASKATEFAAPKAGTVLAGGAGILSGTGQEAYKSAYGAGEEASELGYANSPKAQNFREGMADKIDDETLVNRAKDAARQFTIETSNDFQNTFNKMDDVDMSNNFAPIMDSVFDRVMDEVGPNSRTKLVEDPEALQLVQQMKARYDDWHQGLLDTGNAPTLKTVDNLKRTLARMAAPYRKTNANAFRNADNINSSIRDLLYKASPDDYQPLMEKYEAFKNKMKEYNKTLSLSDGNTVDTATRKLQSALRDQVNTAFGSRLKLLDELDKYSPGLKDAVAGQTLKSNWPRGVARLGPIGAIGGGALGGWHGAFLGELGKLMLSSPKLGGTVAYGLGRAAPATRKITGALGKPFANPISARAVGIAGQANDASMNYKSPFEDQ